MRELKLTIAVTCLALIACAPAARAAMETTIENDLHLTWPWELVSFGVDDELAAGDVMAVVGGRERPAQIVPGAKGEPRVYLIATIDRDDKTAAGRPGVDVAIKRGKVDSPMELTERDHELEISNGIYRIVLPRYTKAHAGKKLSELPGPVRGIGLPGIDGLAGRSHFTGDHEVRYARTKVAANGPVLIRVTHEIGFADNTRYEAMWQFVVGDPWIDVVEAYPDAHGLGYELEFDKKLKADTVMWIRWFGWEGFGGNNRMNWVALKPHPMQRGPFVTLQPRWTQSPGHGQDFFITRGGGPAKDEKAFRPSAYDADAPAIGVVATHPIKWLNPHPQKIRCHVRDGDKARLEFPMSRGKRSYALCAGPRRLFDDTGKLNNQVRRHVDWTLQKQMGYVLSWERDPAKAGPHILISRERLERLQADYRAGRDTPEMRIVRRYEKAAKLKSEEKNLLKLIAGQPVRGRGAPSGGQWIGTRYQDDFLNPTTYTRRIANAFPGADLFSGGKPIGGAGTAALGYIFTDLDHWPGWENGWHPGNPNFHTDKYQVAIFAGAAMLDHPHAKRWLAFGRRNFDEDVAKTLLAPDGVGYECPGYSTYALGMQLDLAQVFYNIGDSNPVAENELFKQTGIWHRQLLTPLDRRIGIRHQAPIGDTHRWGLGDGHVFGKLAKFYKQADPAFASEMMGVWKMFKDQGMGGDLYKDLLDVDASIEPMSLDEMEWSSRHFYGFGSIMRSRFGDERETFVTLKAGPRRGHYHNDELSYHFYGVGDPVSLDYNCSYGPRGDHAALHNSMTFGKTTEYTHKGTDNAVPAMEQIHGTAKVLAFASDDAADVVVAERSSANLELRPIFPRHAIFHYGYPRRSVKSITHRRYLMLVKHPKGSKLNDYLVVRDETQTDQPQQVNIHLLARDVQRDKQDARLIRAEGQWETDAVIYLAQAEVRGYELRDWYYGGGKGHGADGPSAEEVRESDGKVLIPPKGHEGRWASGEYQKWVRLETEPGSTTLWVLYPRRRGDGEPRFETLKDGSIRVTLGKESEEVTLGKTSSSNGNHAVIRRAGKVHVVLGGSVPRIDAAQ